jgi:hypothetical protein
MKYDIEYLILDYNRPEEAKKLLDSIKSNSKFEYKITYLDNGSSEKYAEHLKNQGLIDNLIVNKKNNGCGAGSIQLFAQSFADYAFYVQVDQLQLGIIDSNFIESMVKLIENDGYSYIDLAGDQGHGNYSERAQFISPAFYNSIPKSIGGPGPWSEIKWTEECIQNYIKNNNLKYKSIYINHSGRNYPIFADCGKWSVRQEKDGTIWKHRTDTKTVSIVSGDVRMKHKYYPFSEDQWKEILITKKCDNIVPEGWNQHVFRCWD